MLRAWLAPTTVETFVDTFLHRQPWAAPGAGAAQIPLFGWDTLDRILAADDPDVLVVARGGLVDLPRPRTAADCRALMQLGVGLAMRHNERHDPGLAALAEAFVRDLPGRAHVQAFVTPGGTHGYGWHYDEEDVFIVQTAGAKDYYFRPNTVDDRPPGDFKRFRQETSPMGTARLLPGDCLYIPARWWHMARCLEDSLSISLGVYVDPPSQAGSPGRALHSLSGIG